MVGRVGVEQSDGEVLPEGLKAGPLRLGQGVEVGAELADNRELPPVLPQAGGDIIVAGDDPAVPGLAPVHRVFGAQPPMNGVRIGEKSRRKKLLVKLHGPFPYPSLIDQPVVGDHLPGPLRKTVVLGLRHL